MKSRKGEKEVIVNMRMCVRKSMVRNGWILVRRKGYPFSSVAQLWFKLSRGSIHQHGIMQ